MASKRCKKRVYAHSKERYDMLYEAYLEVKRKFDNGEYKFIIPHDVMPVKYKPCPICKGTGKVTYNKPGFRAIGG